MSHTAGLQKAVEYLLIADFAEVENRDRHQYSQCQLLVAILPLMYIKISCLFGANSTVVKVRHVA